MRPGARTLRPWPAAAAAVWLACGAGARAASAQGPAEGARLAAELGCAGCHSGIPASNLAAGRAPRLGAAGEPLPARFVFDYLADPQPRREGLGATRMPDFRLDEGERLALARFLGRPGSETGLEPVAGRWPAATAARGGRIYGLLGCASCHGDAAPAAPPAPGAAAPAPGSGGGPGDRVGPDLSGEGRRVRPGWLRSWLADPTPVRGPAHPAAPGSRMPDFRLEPGEIAALTEWLTGDAGAAAPAPPPLSPTRAAVARRLLTDRLACLGCHVSGGEGGRIGPSLDRIDARLQPGFVARMIREPRAAVPGAPMPRQPLAAREADDVAALLLARARATPPSAPAVPSLADPAHPAWTVLGDPDADPPAGGAAGALYRRHCAACHGEGGRGDGWNAPSLPVPPTAHADAARMSARPDDTLFDGIHAGAWVLDGSARMPPFGELLEPGEIRALVARIRELCACEQPAWAGDGAGR